MLEQSDLETLLRRSLKPRELEGIDTYLDIAKMHIEQLTGLDLSQCGVQELHYEPRADYHTLFTDIFTDEPTVKINGEVTDKYYVAQWDKRRGEWFNSIVFDKRMSGCEEITVTANWGFCELPSDLALLIAQQFDIASKNAHNALSVKTKRVEDFSITYNDETEQDTFAKRNRAVLQKYLVLNSGRVRHGGI